MRISGLFLPVLSVLLLSACANTWAGTGYAQGNRRAVLAPPEAAGEGGDVVWNEVGQYSVVHFAPPEIFPVTIIYDEVSVFPVDGDAGYYADMKYDFTKPADNAISAPDNDLAVRKAQQIFFAYGSSRIGNEDRKSLKALAADLKRASYEYNVNVVGHASKRVDNVQDPVRRKMINFAMAQKRANAVTKELHAAGASPDWVNALSRGDEEANPHPGNRTQEAADRRADVYVAAGNQTSP